MDSSLRHTTGLTNRIEKLRDDLLRRFDNLVNLAKVDKKDRNTTAVTQYQMQIETAALIRAAEELQSLIRHMQEMWLFGQLKLVGDNTTQFQTDETAKEVAEMLKQLTERQPAAAPAA